MLVSGVPSISFYGFYYYYYYQYNIAVISYTGMRCGSSNRDQGGVTMTRWYSTVLVQGPERYDGIPI